MDPTRGLSTHRRALLRKVGTGGAIAFTGCFGSEDERNDTGANSEGDERTAGTKTDGSTVRVGMVYGRGGLDDKSFNDAANRGIQQATLDFGIEHTNNEPESRADFSQLQKQLATSVNPSYSLICCIGYAQRESLSETATAFPNQQFMLVDAIVKRNNVVCYIFKEHEASFLMGKLAGLLTEKDIDQGGGSTRPERQSVGFVGGRDAPLVHKFQAGFQAGVTHTNQAVEVLTSYVGSFDDPDGGYQAAASMYEEGADIVYHAAGATGVGVFRAAQQHGRYAFGVDVDQSRSKPQYSDIILASMVKRVNVAVYTAVSNLVDEALRTGEVIRLDLERNGVDIVYGTSLGSAIPESVKSTINTSRKAIINGEIKVPSEVNRSGGD